MRKCAILTTIAMTLLIAGLFAQQKGPKVVVAQQKFDFGFMPQGAKVSYTYWLSNIGTDTLRIFSVRPACGCTKAPLTQMVAVPDDSLPIELVFDTSNRKQAQHKNTTVSCNDPTKATFLLEFAGFIYELKDSTPPIMFVGDDQLKLTTKDLGSIKTIKFKNISDKTLKAKLIVQPQELLAVELPSGAIEPGKIGEIRVKLRPSVTEKNQNKSFTFEFADITNSRFSIPVRLAESLEELEQATKK